MNTVPKKNPEGKPEHSPWVRWCGGVGLTFFIALIGYGVALVPGPDHIGSMACTIILAVIFRQLFGYPEVLRPGIEFSGKKLLRYAIVLYGLKLNVNIIFEQGLSLLARDAFTILFSLIVMLILAKWLRADLSLSLLLGVGTGVCGASAIATVSPIVKAKEEDTAISVAIISIIGTIFAVLYTVIRPLLPLSGANYGIWSGISLHEIAQVVLAAAPAGQDPLAMAMLAKLGRVFLLIPLSFALMFWMKRRSKGTVEATSKTPFPWFLIGFILMSLLGSYVIGHSIEIPGSILSGIGSASHFMLTAAMAGLGLKVNLKSIRTKALRPLMILTVTSILLSAITFMSLYL